MKSDEPCCPALKYGRLAGCRFCSLQPGGPSKLCLDMQKIYEDVAWLLRNKIIDKAYDKAVSEYFRDKRSE